MTGRIESFRDRETKNYLKNQVVFLCKGVDFPLLDIQ